MGEPFDGRADQYALALAVYELIAGRRPFLGPSTAALLVQQTTNEPPKLRVLRPAIGEEVAAFNSPGDGKKSPETITP